MTIESADRLIKLRKQNGLSQEELADKLGLSRQAVSKWERAEASPDTDNLICLAKLYGISLDELLKTDDSVETIVEEQVKKEELKEEKKEGIFITDDEGQTVEITDAGIKCKSKDGECAKCCKPSRATTILGAVEGGLFLLAVVAYILLGTLLNMWGNGWVVFFVPEILCSIARAIIKKNPSQVNMPFIAVFAFFFVCMVVPGQDANLWHPMWLVFLSVPVYYCIVSVIKKIMGKEDEDDKVVKEPVVEEPSIKDKD